MKDYKEMTFEVALDLPSEEFICWCEAHPVEAGRRLEDIINEVKELERGR